MLGRRHERDEVVRGRDREIVHDREEARDTWGGPPLVRALFTLIGVGAAGFLIWLATLFDLGQSGEFWAAMGIVAGAGLALGLSQLLGGWTKWGWPTISPGVLLFAFIPTAIVAGWILLATQPEGGWQQSRFESWSSDIGLLGLVTDLGLFAGVLAFAVGLVFAFTFDTTGPRDRRIEREAVVPDEDVHDYEREGTATPPEERGTVIREGDRTRMVPAGDSTREERVEVVDPDAREPR